MATAKTTISAALLVALLAAATATTVDDERSPWEQQQQECQLQGRTFSLCHKYLVEEWKTHIVSQGCCLQLRDVDEQCRCEAIKIVARQVLDEGLEVYHELVLDRATYLISSCSINCQIRVNFE